MLDKKNNIKKVRNIEISAILDRSLFSCFGGNRHNDSFVVDQPVRIYFWKMCQSALKWLF